MNTIIYYISLPFLHLIGFLPERLLYAFSDLAFFILYKVIGYRKDVVRENLLKSFPDKSDEERLTIEKEFFRHLADLVLETISVLHASESRLRRQVHYSNLDVIEKYMSDNQNLVMVAGHVGNWELFGASYGLGNSYPIYVLFSPLQNQYFNKLMNRMRSRTGTNMVPMKEALRIMVKNRGKLSATAFIADQTPPPENAFWTQFLNQNTPFFTGPAKMAKRFNYPIIYYSLKKTARGRYDMIPEVLVDNPSQLSEDEMSERFVRRLEKDIHEMPAYWLWSHRRWKHNPPEKNLQV